MKRRIFAVIFAAIFALAFLTGCGGVGHGEGDTPDTVALVGEWETGGVLQYTFNADGTGRMFLLGNIRWSTGDDILSICVTPGGCGSVSSCSAPSRWEYSVSGDTLTMESLDPPRTILVYTRR